MTDAKTLAAEAKRLYREAIQAVIYQPDMQQSRVAIYGQGLFTAIDALERLASQAPAAASEPDFSHSETLAGEVWKNPLFLWGDRLRMADGAVAFERKINARLRDRLAAPAAAHPVAAEVDEAAERIKFEVAMLEDGYTDMDFRIMEGSDQYFWQATVYAFAGWRAAKRDAAPASLTPDEALQELTDLSQEMGLYEFPNKPLAAPASVQQEAVCERCGESPEKHRSTHWCDNQSFTPPASQTSATASQPVGQGDGEAQSADERFEAYLSTPSSEIVTQSDEDERAAVKFFTENPSKALQAFSIVLAARHPQEATSEDTKRLDFCEQHIVGIECVGSPGWMVFGTDCGDGQTLRAAIDSARRARNPQQAAPTEGKFVPGQPEQTR